MDEQNDPINIVIDGEALRKQVETAINRAMNEAADQLRYAANILDRGAWMEENRRYIENEIQDRIAEALKKADNG